MRGTLRNRFVRWTSALGLLGWCLGSPAWGSDDLPQGADVVAGDISIATDNSDMTITQGTETGIIDWNSFNVGNGFGVHFDNGSGATLNRVTGLDDSFIDGTLTATGSLFLLNRNGIIIGENGRVLTGGDFVASTMDITNADFLNGGDFTLFGTSNADVINLGRISSAGGDVLLAGYSVKNTGDISADFGRAGLAAGTRVDVLTDVSWLGGAYAVSLGERDNNVTNEGRLAAMVAELRTHAGNIYALAGNNDGLIQATGVDNVGGRVILTAPEGTIESSGAIIATAGADGGEIEIETSWLRNYGGLQDVSGAQGGAITISADRVISDTAMLAQGREGDGGTVTVEATDEILLTGAGLIDAGGSTHGGEIAINAHDGRLIHSATTAAQGGLAGGRISFWGDNVSLLGATVLADGGPLGGEIYVGGGYQGGAIWAEPDAIFDTANSRNTYIGAGTLLSADAHGLGKGGTVVAWSDGITQFAGTISARGGELGGDGGVVETSGLEGLGVDGEVDASARAAYGRNGAWLLDPKNITIGTVTDSFSEFERIVLDPAGEGYPVDSSPDGNLGARFGSSLDIEGPTLVVGVGGFNNNSYTLPGFNNDGAAYVFENGGIAARLTSPEGSGGSSFGKEVLITNNVIGVLDGSIRGGSQLDRIGAFYTFAKGDGWRNGTANHRGTAYNPQANEFSFGSAVAAGGGSFYVGAPGYDVGSVTDMGAVHRIFTDGSLSTITPDTYFGGNQSYFDSLPGAGFGSHLAASGNWFYAGWLHYSQRGFSYWYQDWSTGQQGVATRDLSNPLTTAITHNAFAADGDVLAINHGARVDIWGWHHDNGANYSIYTGDRPISDIDFDNGVLIVGDHQSLNNTPYDHRVGFYSSTSQQKLFEIQSPSTSFGQRVAIDGDYAAIGDPTGAARTVDAGKNIGTVSWLQSSETGNWSSGYESSILGPATPDTSSVFGHDVAVDGSTIAIGDPFIGDQRTTDNYGAVYIYEDDSLAAVLDSGLDANNIRFGYSVDLNGTTLATINNPLSGTTGYLHVFERGSGWTNGSGNRTGLVAGSTTLAFEDVAIGDDLAAVTARNSGNGQVDLLLYGNSGTDWQTAFNAGPTSTVTVRPGGTGSASSQLELDGDTLVVRATSTTPPAELLVFENRTNDWSTAVQTSLSAAGVSDLGYDFDVSGDTIIAGSQSASSAYVFARTTDWASAASPAATLNVTGMTKFGHSVAVDDGTVVIYGNDAGGRESFAFFDRQNGWNDGAANLVSTFAADLGGTHRQGGLDLSGDTLVAALSSTTTYPRHALLINGPFDLTARNTYAFSAGASINIAATTLANSLSLGTDVTLQANNDITVSSPVVVNNPDGDGGNLTLTAGRNILVNASITTDNGDLTLIADDPNANQSYRDFGEAVVVLGENVELTLGTGDVLISAADRFENRTGGTSPFTFDATAPGDYLIFAATPDNTGAPDLANLGKDLDIVGRDFLYYGLAFDSNDPTPASLPAGSGLIYTVQPTVRVAVGDSTLTYGETPTAAVALESATLDDSPIDPAAFGITEADLVHLVDAGIADTVPTSRGGYANAGFYAGAVTAEAKAAVTTGGLHGVAVSTGAAGDLTINKAAIDATPGDATRQYRLDDPTFTVSYTGLLAGDSVADIDTAPTVTSAADTLSDVGDYALTASGGSDNNYTINIAGNGTLTITPQDVVINGLVVDDKVYDGTTDATFGGDLSVATFDDDNVSLGGTLSATATFASANVGLDVPVTFSGFFLTGNATKVGNYNLLQPTGQAADITPFALTLSGLIADDRVYDGTTGATLSGTARINPFGSDDVALNGTATASFADRHAGTDKPVSLDGLSLTGAAAGNYTLGPVSSLTATITPLLLTLTGVTADDRTYDATTVATLSGSAVVGAIDGDEVAVTGLPTAAFADKNAGTDKPVTVDGYALTGAHAGNYRLAQPTGLSADITPVTIVVGGVDAVDRTYDATLDIFLSGNPSVTPLEADDLAVAGTPVATLDDKNVGTDKPVTVSGYTLTGADAANYDIVQPTDVTADVSARPITIAGVTVDNKIYDGTTSATSTGTAVLGGILTGDDANLDASGITFAFPDANVGVDKPVSISGIQINGADAGNYTAAVAADLFASISPAMLLLSGVTTVDRVYDSSTAVALAGGALDGVIGDDEVSLVSNGARGTMADKNIGTGKAVTVSGFTLTGATAGNYTLVQPSGLVVDISPYTLNILGLNGDKTYDGTTGTLLSFTGLDAVFDGDVVTINDSAVSATYADKHAGADRIITLSGDFSLDGSDAANYLLNQPVSLTGDIARLGITVTGLTIADKVYDGTTAGEISGTGSFGGAIAGDDLGIAVGDITITFADKNVGTAKPVALSGISLSGADAANYTAETPQGITADITARTVTVDGLGADDKVYDRTPDATLTGTATVDGFVSGDDVVLNTTTQVGRFDDKNVGTDKTVTVSGLMLNGTDAGNYVFADPTTTAAITPAEVALVGITALDRVYDATVSAIFDDAGTLDFGALAGVAAELEDVALSGTPTGTFADKNVGEAKPVTVSAVGLTGTDAGNYVLTLPTLVADITPADLQITGTTVADKVYDATTTATATSFGSLAPLGDDVVSLDDVTLAFVDKNAGQTKAVTATAAAVSGPDVGNYNLLLPTGITATITPAELLLTGISADSRIYDGTTTAPLSGSLQIDPLGGDQVNVVGRPSARFADANVGNGKEVALTGLALAGNDAPNYRLSLPRLAADILVRTLTVTGLFIPDKIYDGTTAATLAGDAVLINSVPGDDLAFASDAVTATFADANAGANKTVSLTGAPLIGSAAANYRLLLPEGLSAAILRKLLEILSVDAVDRDYDGTVDVDLTGGELSGVITDDVVTLDHGAISGTVADKNAAADKPVTVTGFALGGSDAANYAVAQPTDVTVDITPLELAVNGLAIADKFFDGNTTATVTGGQLEGFISGDDVSLDRTNERADFLDSDVGEDKSVAVTGLVVGGADGGNYTLPESIEVSGTILATLETITDVVPVEVLQATAEAEREAARRELEQAAAAADDAVELIDFEAANSNLLSGIAGAPLDPDVFSIPADQRDPTVDAYINAAYAADAAATVYNQQAETMRAANRAFKALTQDYNTAVRDAQVAEGLQETLQQELATLDNELATLDGNLAAIATAKERIAEFQQRIREANRLGRGNEVAALEQMLAEARAVVDAEADLLAQRGALLAARTESERRLAENADVIARRDELKTQYDNAKTDLDDQKTSLVAAKNRAEEAVAATEKARAAGEAKARELLANATRSRELAEDSATTSLDATVDQILEGFANRADGDMRTVADAFPLSAEREAELAAAGAAQEAALQRLDQLAQSEAAAESRYRGVSPDARSTAQRAINRNALMERSSAELAQLDPRDLGLDENEVLSSFSPAVDSLERATNSLSSSASALGELRGPLGTRFPLTLPDSVTEGGDRGLDNLDQPLSFDPTVEAALKFEMQSTGLLPRFTSPALADLPVAQQLKLNSAMQSLAADMAAAEAAGTPITRETMQERLDDQTTQLLTMALFDTLGKRSMLVEAAGDIPGVQAAVGAMMGEIGAQYGISTAPLVQAMSGDISGATGLPQNALNGVASIAQQVVEDPVGAGIDLVSDTVNSIGNVAKAGGEAFVKSWIGSGGSGDDGPTAAELRAAQEAFETRREELSQLGSSILAVESRREAAVQAREQAYTEIKTAIVAQAEVQEARQAQGALPSRSALEQERAAAVDAKRDELQREQIAEAVRPDVEAAQEREARNIANAEAGIQRGQAMLAAFTEEGGEG